MDSELFALLASEIFIRSRGFGGEDLESTDNHEVSLETEAPISHISASLEMSCLGHYSFKTFPLATQQVLLGVNIGNILEAKIFLVLHSPKLCIYIQQTSFETIFLIQSYVLQNNVPRWAYKRLS